MNTFWSRIFVVVVATFGLLSCDDVGLQQNEIELPETGSLFFTFSKATMPEEVYWIVARLEHPDFMTITDSVSVSASGDTAQLQIKFVEPGTWSLTVSAKDSTGIERYKGTTSVIIERGEITSANLALDPLFGGLEINITWPAPIGTWKMYANNPILEQTPGGFDADYFFFHDPKVLKVNGIYRMWYTTGYNQFVQGIDRNWIAYAVSADGITWTKQGAVVHPGPLGSWNERGVTHPAVLYDNGIYKMWFSGNSATVFGTAIGYAESNDGAVWNVHPQLVIVGSASKPELRHPEVIKQNGIYYLYYNYGALALGSIEVHLMTSTDGQQWTDRAKVLSKRSGVPWETRGVLAPSVMFDQNKFRMFYTGLGTTNETIGYAESADGIHWPTRSADPLLVPSQSTGWTITYASHPTVLRDGGKLRMWFSGLSVVPYRWEIGYAERN
ncbi:MAG TPA: hypothetical protein VIL52_07675 [Bacteroidota bacterium]